MNVCNIGEIVILTLVSIRTLGFYDGLSVAICIMIGTGIFASPGTALDNAGSPGASLVAWLLAGCITLIASTCVIELATMMPGVGGDYIYIYKAFGRTASFSYAWYYFWVAKPGTQAIVATVFGNYFTTLFMGLENADESSGASTACSVVIIILLTLLNCLGLMEAKGVMYVFTFAKFALVTVIIVTSIVYLSTDMETLRENLGTKNAFDGTNGQGFGTALIACLWSFEGWSDLMFLSEEIIDFEKNIGRICVYSLLVVTTCFVVIDFCYLIVLPEKDITSSDAVAIDFGLEVSGRLFGGFFALVVALSAAGAANGLILTGSRAFLAVAKARQAPMLMARLNYAGVPAITLCVQAVWTIVLVLIPGSSFTNLLDYIGPASWIFYALACSAVIRLRMTEPSTPRPYRVPFYPLPPIIIIAVAVYLLTNTLLRAPLFCILALCFVALSVPVWWVLDSFKVFGVDVASAPASGALKENLLMPTPRTMSNSFF
jgi:amino acid transporter